MHPRGFIVFGIYFSPPISIHVIEWEKSEKATKVVDTKYSKYWPTFFLKITTKWIG